MHRSGFYAMLTIATTMLLSACSMADQEYRGNDEIKGLAIAYGTSFGECKGYCIHTVVVTKNTISHKKSGWNDSINTLVCNKPAEPAVWDSLLMYMDLETFANLPEVMGCPDCADGGAEWIEVISETLQKKISFEYGNEPEEVKKYIDILRRITNCFENCGDD